MGTVDVDVHKADELERRFDAEMRFRPVLPPATWIVATLLLALSCFHYYTAGFGLLREQTHRGIHMAFVLGLIFMIFAADRKHADAPAAAAWWKPGGVPLYDWALLAAAAVASLYLPAIFEDIAFRVGNPLPLDVAMGTALTMVVLEATRRTMGWPLVLIALGFITSRPSASACAGLHRTRCPTGRPCCGPTG